MNPIDDILIRLDLHGFDGHGGTDKGTDHSYTAVYHDLFKDRRDEPLHLVEIGVYHGGSAALWPAYFSSATFTFIDTHDQIGRKARNLLDTERSTFIWEDAYKDTTAKAIKPADIVIDDGPHTLESMQACIALYGPLMRPGGIMVIEDIPFRWWADMLLVESQVDGIVMDLDIQRRHDDRLLVLRWPSTT